MMVLSKLFISSVIIMNLIMVLSAQSQSICVSNQLPSINGEYRRYESNWYIRQSDDVLIIYIGFDENDKKWFFDSPNELIAKCNDIGINANSPQDCNSWSPDSFAPNIKDGQCPTPSPTQLPTRSPTYNFPTTYR
eukprot:307881_1